HRNAIASFLEELNLMMNPDNSTGYNRAIVYQDIQPFNHRFYTALTEKQQSELLFQYLLSFYFDEGKEETLLEKLSKKSFYALGTASLYYDRPNHLDMATEYLFVKILQQLKAPDAFDEQYSNHSISKNFRNISIDNEELLTSLKDSCSEVDPDLTIWNDQPDLHPVWEFTKASLIPDYFLHYIKFMPARWSQFVKIYSYSLTSRLFSIMERHKRQKIEVVKSCIENGCLDFFTQSEYPYSTLAQLRSYLKKISEKLLAEKKRIENNQQYFEIDIIPKKLQKNYRHDKKEKVDSSSFHKITDDLKKSIKKEPAVLGLLARCFLLGTLSVFVLIPLLRWLSPSHINLGNVNSYDLILVPIIFILPFIYYFIHLYRRHYKVIKKQYNKLLIHIFDQVMTQCSNQIKQEGLSFYHELIQHCDKQLQYIDHIEGKLSHDFDKSIFDLPIPETTFNQSLLLGNFMQQKVLLTEAISCTEVEMEGKNHKIKDLVKSDFNKLLKYTMSNISVSEHFKEQFHFSDKEEEAAIGKTAKCIGAFLKGIITINSDQNMGNLLKKIHWEEGDSAFDFTPLLCMAGVNGMISEKAGLCGYDIKCGSDIKNLLGKEITLVEESNQAMIPYLFVTFWCMPESQLNSETLCGGMQIKNTSAISKFSTLLTRYYSEYKSERFHDQGQKSTRNIDRTEMQKIDFMIDDTIKNN
ncbi:MAG: hypothetical protein RR356_07145, partial [Bacteroidales bacterium]